MAAPSGVNDEYVNPKKVSPNKVCEYIRAAYLDGKTRITSYAENIDPNVHRANYRYRFTLVDKLEHRPDFEELKTMVMEEDNKDMLLRSATAQKKAMELLLNMIDKANENIMKHSDDPKLFGASISVAKAIAPVLAVAGGKNDSERVAAGKRARAAKVINGGVDAIQ